MIRAGAVVAAVAVAAFMVLAVVVSAPAGAATCGRFIVGEANSSAYPGFRLPARGKAVRASCDTLRRIARRLHDGTYPVPRGAGEQAPDFGRSFRVKDRGRSWRCQLQLRGGSGPTYAMACERKQARLTWNTG